VQSSVALYFAVQCSSGWRVLGHIVEQTWCQYVLVGYLLGSLCFHQTQDCMIVIPLQGPCCQSSRG
jgi:hypothetical protein